MDTFRQISQYIETYVQGVFGEDEMALMKEELDKLNDGDVVVEIGVDEGRSSYVTFKFAKPGVIRIGIDINDPGIAIAEHEGVKHQVSIGRRDFFKQEKMVGLDINGLYVHGDANVFATLFHEPFVNLLFIDGFHNYEAVRKNVDRWLPLMKPNGVILFHDYIDPNSDGVKPVVDETFGDKAEIIGEMARVRL